MEAITFILSLAVPACVFNPGMKSRDCSSLCRQFWTFTQLVAIELANTRVSESLTAKIKNAKISATPIFGSFNENLSNYQLYSMSSVIISNERVFLIHSDKHISYPYNKLYT